nr:MAG TPA: hypothetical protein [Caudoviricetes sp.]
MYFFSSISKIKAILKHTKEYLTIHYKNSIIRLCISKEYKQILKGTQCNKLNRNSSSIWSTTK